MFIDSTELSPHLPLKQMLRFCSGTLGNSPVFFLKSAIYIKVNGAIVGGFLFFWRPRSWNCPGVLKYPDFFLPLSLSQIHIHTLKHRVDSNPRGLKNTPSNMQICLQPDFGGENSRLTAGNSHFSKVAKCLRWFKKNLNKTPSVSAEGSRS